MSEAAEDAIELGDPNYDENGNLKFALWLETIEDESLRWELRDANLWYNSADPIRNAFVMLEDRIRAASGAPKTAFGTELVKFAFDPKDGVLQPISEAGSERVGFREIFDGAFKLYRNSAAHQATRHEEREARRILALVDHCLCMVSQALERTVPISNFVGTHEGVIHHRRDFRIDIDGDGSNEIVVLLGHRQVFEGGEYQPHLATLILKDGGAGYRRIRAERLDGYSMYGPISAVVRNCTGGTVPDLVISWSVGESQTVTFVLRNQNDEYVLARKDPAGRGPEYYSASSERWWGTHPAYLHLDFADIDGDGIFELIQRCRFPTDELEKMGLDARLLEDERSRPFRSAVWKWNPTTGQFEVIHDVWVSDPHF